MGVVNADNALYDENYLSHERAFDLITQVVGRSGRRDATGMAVIQTIDPCNPVIDLAARQSLRRIFRHIRRFVQSIPKSSSVSVSENGCFFMVQTQSVPPAP